MACRLGADTTHCALNEQSKRAKIEHQVLRVQKVTGTSKEQETARKRDREKEEVREGKKEREKEM